MFHVTVCKIIAFYIMTVMSAAESFAASAKECRKKYFLMSEEFVSKAFSIWKEVVLGRKKELRFEEKLFRIWKKLLFVKGILLDK